MSTVQPSCPPALPAPSALCPGPRSHLSGSARGKPLLACARSSPRASGAALRAPDPHAQPWLSFSHGPQAALAAPTPLRSHWDTRGQPCLLPRAGPRLRGVPRPPPPSLVSPCSKLRLRSLPGTRHPVTQLAPQPQTPSTLWAHNRPRPLLPQLLQTAPHHSPAPTPSAMASCSPPDQALTPRTDTCPLGPSPSHVPQPLHPGLTHSV